MNIMDKTRNYIVYFELYGKKMRAKILAKGPQDAKDKLTKKIIFHKVILDKGDEFNKSVDMLDDIINIFK